MLSRIRSAFGAIKNVGKPLPVTEVEPPQDGERRITLRHAANLPAVAEAYHVPNYRSGSDAYALELAGEILGDGKSSRLYKDLVVDKQMWPLVDLRVDWSDEGPVAALRELWRLYEPQMKDYVTRALDPHSAPAYGVPGDP